MTHRLIVTAVVLVAWPFHALGETPGFEPKLSPLTPEELTEAVLAIQTQVQELSKQDPGAPTEAATPSTNGDAATGAELTQSQDDQQQLRAAVAGNTSNLGLVIEQQETMAAKLQDVTTRLKEITTSQQELAGQIQELNAQLGQVRTSQEEFQGEISDQIAEINTQLGEISRDIGGSRTLRFDNIQDVETQQQFQTLVKKTTPPWGQVTIDNKMETGQRIFVNRVEYYVRPGEERTIEVRPGNASTQLPGQDVVNWTIAAPNYEQSIQIVPERTSMRVNRSIAPPVYYESPPVFVEPYVTYVPGW